MRDTFLRLYFTTGSMVYALSWHDRMYLLWAGIGLLVALLLLVQDIRMMRRRSK